MQSAFVHSIYLHFFLFKLRYVEATERRTAQATEEITNLKKN